jgi:hypothetical protein
MRSILERPDTRSNPHGATLGCNTCVIWLDGSHLPTSRHTLASRETSAPDDVIRGRGVAPKKRAMSPTSRRCCQDPRARQHCFRAQHESSLGAYFLARSAPATACWARADDARAGRSRRRTRVGMKNETNESGTRSGPRVYHAGHAPFDAIERRESPCTSKREPPRLPRHVKGQGPSG